MAITSPPGSARRPPERAGPATHRCVRGWWAVVGGRDGPGRPGGRRRGCGGSGEARQRGVRTARRPVAILAGRRGLGGRRWRPGCRGCGPTPTAGGCAGQLGRGDPGQLLGQGRPRVAMTRTVADGRKLDPAGWPLRRSTFQPLQQHRWDLAGWGVQVAAGGPLVGVARVMPAGGALLLAQRLEDLGVAAGVALLTCSSCRSHPPHPASTSTPSGSS
jgi:hypothetical protein